jgi:hypothetical protein
MMGPSLRKFVLTGHVTASVGWLGAVAAFLVLSIVGIASRDGELVRSMYLAMNLVGAFLIVPLSFLTLATGLIQSLGTSWGLFRHYWVVVKLMATLLATLLLVLHQFVAVSAAAQAVRAAPMNAATSIGRLGVQLVVDAALALLVLLFATVLSCISPGGEQRTVARFSRQTER